MLLGLIILLSVIVLIWLYRRDQKFFHQEIKDVLSDDMKAAINMPTDGDMFNQELDGIQKKTSVSSIEIIKKMNHTN